MLRSNVLIKFYRDALYLFDLENNRQFKLDYSHSFELLKILFDPFQESIDRTVQRSLDHFCIKFDKKEKESTWPLGELSRIFHIGTQNIYDTNEVYANRVRFLEKFEETNRSCYQSLKKFEELKEEREVNSSSFKLPKVDIGKLNGRAFSETILERRTCRQFKKCKLALEVVSEILYLTFGHEGDFKGEVLSAEPKRIVPSAGNIHPINLYLNVSNVKELDYGIYSYNKKKHELSVVRRELIRQERMEELFLGQYFMENSSFGVFITIDFEKLSLKYPDSRSYKYAYVEVGVVAYHLQLLATYLKLQFWQTGVFKELLVDQLLQLKENETAAFYLAFGKGEGHALPKDC